MSISLNTTIDRNLPASTIRSSSVIKNSGTSAKEIQTKQFSTLVSQEPHQPEIVTKEEKQYFEDLFPKAATSIRSYSGYSVGGQRTQVSLGTIIDAKG